MKIRIELSEKDLKNLVCNYISEQIGNSVDLSKIAIETRSKQNYKSEWEIADFRAVYEKQ